MMMRSDRVNVAIKASKTRVHYPDGKTEDRDRKAGSVQFITTGDPVAVGIVDSLARPGGNLTGFTEIGAVLGGKRLELLKETVPKLSRVALLWNPDEPTAQWKESQLSAQDWACSFIRWRSAAPTSTRRRSETLLRRESAALAVTQSAFTSSTRTQIVELAAKYRLPVIYDRRDDVESGGLMSYGSDRVDMNRRVAAMIDKILKGPGTR